MPRKALETRKNNQKEKINEESIEEKLDKHLEKRYNELFDNIRDKINEHIEFQINKRIKEEEKKYVRGQKIKIIRLNFLILILLVIVCYFGYCLFEVDYFHIRNINTDNKNTNTIMNPINPDQEESSDTFNKESLIKEYKYLIDNLIIEDETIYDLFQDNITKENISNDLKLKIAYKNLKNGDIKKENDIISFSQSAIEESLKKVLGGSTTLENRTFNYNKTRFIFYNNTYLGMEETNTKTNFLYEITDAEMNDNKLTFNIITAKLSDKNELLNSKNDIVLEEYNNEKLETNKEHLDQFTIIFDNINENFILSAIKKLI